MDNAQGRERPDSTWATEGSSIDRLSPRRREVLRLLARGLTNDDIAGALCITPATVRTHVTAVLAHLDVANRTEAASMYIAWESRPARVAEVLQRPAIAVLPLLGIGEDPRTRAVAAGLTEDLACLFARWCWFPVISTLSSADARSLGLSGRELGARLGARFLLDASVRLGGGAFRLVVHIDDAESGYRLWSDRYDCSEEELFQVQDALCHAIVAAAYPVLIARSLAIISPHRPPAELAAWELAHAGMAMRSARDPRANEQAMSRFREAIERDPGLVLAHYGAGLAAYDAVLNQWGPEAAALDRLLVAGERCVELSPHAAEGYYLLGRHLQSRGEWERAVAPLEAAIGHNPSFALAHASLSQSLQATGRSDEGLLRMKHAARLGPSSFVAGLATLHFMRQEYAESLEQSERAIVKNPGYAFARALAAASAFWLGQKDRAQAHMRSLRERHPQFRPDKFASTFGARVDAVSRITQALAMLSGRR